MRLDILALCIALIILLGLACINDNTGPRPPTGGATV